MGAGRRRTRTRIDSGVGPLETGGGTDGTGIAAIGGEEGAGMGLEREGEGGGDEKEGFNAMGI